MLKHAKINLFWYLSLVINLQCIHDKIIYHNARLQLHVLWSTVWKFTAVLRSVQKITFG